MSKKNIHPELHRLKVTRTDGSQFDILTTHGKADGTLILDSDPLNHPAWNEKALNVINNNNARVSKFNKFGNFLFDSESK
jgi:large subunit ribosomal protein L31